MRHGDRHRPVTATREELDLALLAQCHRCLLAARAKLAQFAGARETCTTLGEVMDRVGHRLAESEVARPTPTHADGDA